MGWSRLATQASEATRCGATNRLALGLVAPNETPHYVEYGLWLDTITPRIANLSGQQTFRQVALTSWPRHDDHVVCAMAMGYTYGTVVAYRPHLGDALSASAVPSM